MVIKSWNTVHLNDKWNGITLKNFFLLHVYTHTHTPDPSSHQNCGQKTCQ